MALNEKLIIIFSLGYQNGRQKNGNLKKWIYLNNNELINIK